MVQFHHYSLTFQAINLKRFVMIRHLQFFGGRHSVNGSISTSKVDGMGSIPVVVVEVTIPQSPSVHTNNNPFCE